MIFTYILKAKCWKNKSSFLKLMRFRFVLKSLEKEYLQVSKIFNISIYKVVDGKIKIKLLTKLKLNCALKLFKYPNRNNI